MPIYNDSISHFGNSKLIRNRAFVDHQKQTWSIKI